jgi:hypothetical protein
MDLGATSNKSTTYVSVLPVLLLIIYNPKKSKVPALLGKDPFPTHLVRDQKTAVKTVQCGGKTHMDETCLALRKYFAVKIDCHYKMDPSIDLE